MNILKIYFFHCLDAPEWVEPPRDTRITLGAGLLLHCGVRGEPKPEIEWTQSGIKLISGTWDRYK